MIVDAKNMIAGRLATIVAKKALLGEKIDVINAEKAVLTGRREDIFKKYKSVVERGIPAKGPFLPRSPDRLLRRIIRGMLPYKKSRGIEAFRRVMCWKGVPEQFKNQKTLTFKEADVLKVNIKYQTLEELSLFLGGKID